MHQAGERRRARVLAVAGVVVVLARDLDDLLGQAPGARERCAGFLVVLLEHASDERGRDFALFRDRLAQHGQQRQLADVVQEADQVGALGLHAERLAERARDRGARARLAPDFLGISRQTAVAQDRAAHRDGVEHRAQRAQSDAHQRFVQRVGRLGRGVEHGVRDAQELGGEHRVALDQGHDVADLDVRARAQVDRAEAGRRQLRQLDLAPLDAQTDAREQLVFALLQRLAVRRLVVQHQAAACGQCGPRLALDLLRRARVGGTRAASRAAGLRDLDARARCGARHGVATKKGPDPAEHRGGYRPATRAP